MVSEIDPTLLNWVTVIGIVTCDPGTALWMMAADVIGAFCAIIVTKNPWIKDRIKNIIIYIAFITLIPDYFSFFIILKKIDPDRRMYAIHAIN
jgi:hypothetical protein